MADTPGSRERTAITETLLRVGPSAPTLCEGWSTLQLAAHLYVRERDPFAGPGIVLPGPFARFTERRMAVAQKRGYDALVQSIRGGPPLHWRLVPDIVHLVEYFVHHEDVRRAGDSETEPQPLDDGREDALWRWLVRGGGRVYTRAFRGGVAARRLDGTTHTLRAGSDMVTMVGPVSEVVLFLHGRKSTARLEFEGPDDAVDALRAADFSV